MYCARFGRLLRGKVRFFTEGNEGSEDSCGYGLDFLQKATKRTKVFAAAEDKAFVSFVVFCLESSPVHPLYEKADKLSFEVNRRRKQRYLALDFGHDLALAKHNLCSLRYLLFKRFIRRQGGGPVFPWIGCAVASCRALPLLLNPFPNLCYPCNPW